jgi:hypothetical protein
MKVEKANPYGALSESRLKAFEEELGVRLPDAYREFLLRFNGGRWKSRIFRVSDKEGESEVHHVYGLHEGPDFSRLDRAWESLRGTIPPSVIPIADDPGGNKICLGIGGSDRAKVFFCEHEWARNERGEAIQKYALSQISGSFEDFVAGLEKQSAPTNRDDIGEIIKRDDRVTLARLIDSGTLDLETEDENGRTPIERAAIAGSAEIIKDLLKRGARLRKSLELAKENAEFFDGHRAIVALLERSGRK